MTKKAKTEKVALKPKTDQQVLEDLRRSMDGVHQQMLSEPLDCVNLQLAIHRKGSVEDVVFATIDYGDGDGIMDVDSFVQEASHLLTPGSLLYRKTINFNIYDLLKKTNEAVPRDRS